MVFVVNYDNQSTKKKKKKNMVWLLAYTSTDNIKSYEISKGIAPYLTLIA